MQTDDAAPRMYRDLAGWWPLISPPEDYADEGAAAAGLLACGSVEVHDVLELGSGGGNTASHLKSRFAMTLVDLSDPMLAVSRALNPECAHHEGDMRTVRLGRLFDAVFIHDAIAYMTTEDDLRAALTTAAAHCRPGGVVLVAPDETTESFESTTGHGGVDAPDGRGARYLEWSWDPDPHDTWTQTEYVLVLREADGRVTTVHDRHRTGLFAREVWLRVLSDVGLAGRMEVEQTDADRRPRDLFVGIRG
jgi:SAM-dependent methyltransferase